MNQLFKEVVNDDGSYKFYLNGQWKTSESGKTVKVLNPMTNEAVFYV